MDITKDSHLNMKWKINPDDEQEVITDEPSADEYWSVCDVCNGLPGDDDEGILTAQQIVADHNAMLTVVPALLAIAERAIASCTCHSTMTSGIPCLSCAARAAVEAARDTMRGTP